MHKNTFSYKKYAACNSVIKNLNYLAIVLIVITAGCDSFQPSWLKIINSEELNQRMQQQDIFLVDVHVPEQRHIKGTDAFIPYDKVNNYLERLPIDKNTPIYLYCEGGGMGETAAKTLYELGYRNLTNLEGGAKAWQKNGFAFE